MAQGTRPSFPACKITDMLDALTALGWWTLWNGDAYAAKGPSSQQGSERLKLSSPQLFVMGHWCHDTVGKILG